MDKTFKITLGGRSWDLPHLPFRITREIEPVLFRLAREMETSESGTWGVILRLDEARLAELGQAAWRALNFVDKDMTREVFDDLPFGATELVATFLHLAGAVGMHFEPAGKTKTKASAPGEAKAGR